MAFEFLFRNLRRRTIAKNAQRRHRPLLEFLEDRTLPAGLYYVANGERIDLAARTDQYAIKISDANPGQILSDLTAAGGPLAGFVVGEKFAQNVWRLDSPAAPPGPSNPAQAAANVVSRFSAPGVDWLTTTFVNSSNQQRVLVIDEVVVGLRPGITPAYFFRGLSKTAGLFSYRPLIGTPDQFVVTLAGRSGAATLDVANHLATDTRVSYAAPNLYQDVKRYSIPNDTLYPNQWHLNNTGTQLPDAIAGADVKAQNAWNLSTGAGVTIAVVDTGMERTHPDLAANMFVNSGEVPGNGIDDDGNGFVDDVSGWSFANNSPTPNLGTSDLHATSVAGVAAGVGNNNLGVTGVAYNAKILPVQIFDGNTYVGDAGAASAIYYAAGRTANGLGTWNAAQVINCSWGGGSPATVLTNAFTWASNTARGGKGVATFIASGNDYNTAISYPANLSQTLSGVMAVGASNQRDLRSEYSNYGTGLDFVAPSSDVDAPYTGGITTTDRTGSLGYNTGDYTNNTVANGFGGTSSATPLAAGVGALLLSFNPTLTAAQVRAALRATADKVGGVTYDASGFNIQYGYGRVNAFAALQSLGMQVTATTPAKGGTVAAPPALVGGYRADFNFAYDQNAANIDLSKVAVNGVMPTSYTVIDADTLQFNFTANPVTIQGSQSFTIAAGAVKRQSNGDLNAAYSGFFRYDITALLVTTTVPTSPGGVFTLPAPLTYVVNFNEDIDGTSVGLNDLTLSTGTVIGASRTGVGQATYTLSGITAEGALTITLPAGAVTDTFGNPTRTAYTGTYTTDFGTTAYPTPLTAKSPPGSLVYDPTVTGIISPAGDIDNFTISIDPGQKITVYLDPAATLKGTIKLFDANNNQIGAATSASTGFDAVIQTVSTGVGTQKYRIEVSGGGTAGAYTLGLVLNAREEAERHNGIANDTFNAAEDIGGSFISLSPTATRGAVLGTAGGSDYYQFALTAGDTVTLALQSLSVTTGTLTVKLFDPSNVLVGTAIVGAGNVSSLLNNAVAQVTGSYRALVTTNTTGITYNLVVLRNADFDRQGNTSFASAQFIAGADGVLGYSGAANSVVVSAANSGWYDQTGFHNSTNTNYVTGLITNGTIVEARDFFTFSLAGITQQITSAQLQVFNPANGYSSPDASENLAIFDVSTPVSTLVAGGTGLTGIFNDLGSGTSFGAQTVSSADNGQLVSVNLNAAGVAALNAAAGGSVALGGAITTIAGAVEQYAFGFSSADARQLTLGLGSLEHWYSFAVNAGDNLNLQTSTPAAGAGEFVNGLNPKIDLYDPSNVLVASGIVLGDGLNEQILHTATATGLYRIRLTSEAGSAGEFFVSIAGNTGSAQAPFQVSAITPADGSNLNTQPTTITVDFNDAVLASSVQASDLKVDGTINATSVTQIDGDTYAFTIAGGLGQGLHTLSFAAGSINDVQQTPINSFLSSFNLDTIGPRVTATSVASNAVLSPGALTLTVTFSEAMKASNLSADDFTLHGNLRQAAGVSYAPASFSFDAAGTTLTLNYANLPDDHYTLTLLAGTTGGTNFTDVAGVALDGEFSGTFPSGNGTPGGDFVLGFDMDPGAEAYPIPLSAKAPLGSLIYDPSLTRTIVYPADTDSFTLAVDAGQFITVLVTTTTPSFRPMVTLLNQLTSTSISASAAGIGQPALIQNSSVGPVGATYTITVGGTAGTTGLYTLQVILNAAIENEGTLTGVTDNTSANAQNINSSFLALQTGQAQASRGAVVGTTDAAAGYSAAAITPTFTDISASGTTVIKNADDTTAAVSIGFNFTFYGTNYTSLFVSDNGLITFGTAFTSFSNGDLASTPAQAAIAPFWDDLYPFNANSTAAVKTLVSGAVGSRQLIIQWDKINFWPNTSADTLTFQAILREGSNSIQFNYLDLVSGTSAGNNGTSATVGIKAPGATTQFLQLALNNGPNTYVGTGKSTLITFGQTTPDFYSFSATAGQTATLTLTGLSAGAISVDLIAPNGTTVLASGIAAANLTSAISNYTFASAGTYFARVNGGGFVPYSLVVTRDAAFDTEFNNTFATAQTLDPVPGVLGSVASGNLPFNFESGQQGFTINNNIRGTGASAGLWHLTTRRSAQSGHSPVTSFYYGSDSTGTFDTGAANAGSITSAPLLIAPGATLSFNYVLQTEGNGSFDVASVQVSVNGGTSFTNIASSSSAAQLPLSSTWRTASFDLSAYAGQSILLRFNFDTLDSIGNGYEGWYVDDVQIGAAGDEDWYSFSVPSTSNIIRLETSTPGDGPGEFANALNPRIELYDPAGVLLSSGIALADGRNEFLQYQPLVTGTYRIRILPQGGTSGEYFLTQTSFVDSTLPTAAITNNPPVATNSTTANFGFTGDDPLVGDLASGLNHLETKLDSGAFTTATSPQNFSGLSEGAHTFQVRAVDNAGNVGLPANYSWTIDLTAPTASISAQPPAFTNSAAADFSFTGDDPLAGGVSSGVNHLETKLDSGAFTTATSPQNFSGLSEGAHTFQVRAVDNAGNVSQPALYSWTTVYTAPQVQSDSPATGLPSGGVPVTITGSGYVAVTGVMFGAVAASSFTVVDSTHIIATVPAGTGTVDVTVINVAGTSATSAADRYAYVKATPILTWATPADIVYGTALGAPQLNASANVPGTFSYSAPAGTVFHAGLQQAIVATFTPANTTDYTIEQRTVYINVTVAALTIKANNIVVTGGLYASVPLPSATYIGLVNGDGPSAIAQLAFRVQTFATPQSPIPKVLSKFGVGTYQIVVGWGVSTDYSIDFVFGTLTVLP